MITFPQPQVPNGLSPDLVISPVQLKDAGFYICRVNCGDALEFSQWAQVDVLNVNMFCGKISQSHFCDFEASALVAGQATFSSLEYVTPLGLNLQLSRHLFVG